MAKLNKITNEGLKKLEDELSFLKTIRRKEVSEQIKTARGLGDLSENSEYDEAREEQAKVEARISELENMLENVEVISEHELTTDTVNVGSKVRVFDEKNNEEIEYTVVGSSEANALKRKISDQSPIGSALMGAKVNETVTAYTPGGELNFKIIEISK
ncbi:MAG: transcription elongation factor GreA [Oscillospiraceae bacterium]|nr:MAG: transcription elongation factor GreA [Oscillospiraceae bacterium]